METSTNQYHRPPLIPTEDTDQTNLEEIFSVLDNFRHLQQISRRVVVTCFGLKKIPPFYASIPLGATVSEAHDTIDSILKANPSQKRYQIRLCDEKGITLTPSALLADFMSLNEDSILLIELMEIEEQIPLFHFVLQPPQQLFQGEKFFFAIEYSQTLSEDPNAVLRNNIYVLEDGADLSAEEYTIKFTEEMHLSCGNTKSHNVLLVCMRIHKNSQRRLHHFNIEIRIGVPQKKFLSNSFIILAKRRKRKL